MQYFKKVVILLGFRVFAYGLVATIDIRAKELFSF